MIDLDALSYTYENNYFSFDLRKVPGIQNGDIISFSVTASTENAAITQNWLQFIQILQLSINTYSLSFFPSSIYNSYHINYL